RSAPAALRAHGVWRRLPVRGRPWRGGHVTTPGPGGPGPGGPGPDPGRKRADRGSWEPDPRMRRMMLRHQRREYRRQWQMRRGAGQVNGWGRGVRRLAGVRVLPVAL